MGDLTLDLNVDGSFPFHDINDQYDYGLRIAPRLRYEFTPEVTTIVGPALQIGREDALSDAKVRLFRLTPDPRLFKIPDSDVRLDIPELYAQFKPSSQWQFRIGRNYWDNTIHRRFRDWSYEGFTDGNLADASIHLGLGGDVRFHQPMTKSFPVDLKLSASAALGGKKEGLGLIQGLATFNMFDPNKMPGWVTVLGGTLGYVYYPQDSLPSLLPGIAATDAGGALSPSVYLQQGLGNYFDLSVGYGQFVPVQDSSANGATPLKGRKNFMTGLDFHQQYWGIHANYGRVWRDDLAGFDGTKVEDQFGLSARVMVLGQKSRALNFVVGGIATRSDDKFNIGAYGAFQLSIERLSPTKF
ncbi:MAG: hypothetical protein K8R69_08030 [Deltaproteobacteria bacterium]|nr:hypothetical protein [Deltaproteobacteria bacterium]